MCACTHACALFAILWICVHYLQTRCRLQIFLNYRYTTLLIRPLTRMMVVVTSCKSCFVNSSKDLSVWLGASFLHFLSVCTVEQNQLCKPGTTIFVGLNYTLNKIHTCNTTFIILNFNGFTLTSDKSSIVIHHLYSQDFGIGDFVKILSRTVLCQC